MDSKFRIEVAYRSDVGCVRGENQDSTTIAVSMEPLDRGRLLAVADGMGGARGGAEASQIAMATIKELYYVDSDPDLAGSLLAAMEAANDRIQEYGRENDGLSQMGTTCSALVINGTQAFFAHVGDSRIYLVRDGAIRQLTQDHTLVSAMHRAGILTAEEAENHRAKNVLERALGQDDVEIDLGVPIELNDGDVFVLCSDGLYRVVTDEEIRELVQSDPAEAVEAMTDMAIDRGAPDNVTTIVARLRAG